MYGIEVVWVILENFQIFTRPLRTLFQRFKNQQKKSENKEVFLSENVFQGGKSLSERSHQSQAPGAPYAPVL